MIHIFKNDHCRTKECWQMCSPDDIHVLIQGICCTACHQDLFHGMDMLSTWAVERHTFFGRKTEGKMIGSIFLVLIYIENTGYVPTVYNKL